MKILKKAKSKLLVLLTALVLAVVSMFAGFNVSAMPKANADGGMEYIDTQVDSIGFVGSGGKFIFAFRLTVQDYADFTNPPGELPENTAKYNYITSLGYWKNFENMNSAGAKFAQPFAYWNGGWGDSQIGAAGKNGVGHLSSLTSLTYGFMISIPAGTTFPSLTYIQGGCEGTPKAYRTTTNVAFFYDGTKFAQMDYQLAEVRMEALDEIEGVDYSIYLEKEKQEVAALVQSTKGALEQCMSLVEVSDVMDGFYAALAQVKTNEYYAELDGVKTAAKQDMATFFNGFNQSAYGEEEWALLNVMKAEAETLIDGAQSFEEVATKVAGIKNAANEVLMDVEKPEFAAFITNAVGNVEASFNASLYREAQAAEGAAIVAEGKALLEKATTYAEVEAVELKYIAKIDALKTAAELDLEEANKEEKPAEPEIVEPQPETEAPSQEEPKKGCGSSVMNSLVIISLAVMATLIVIMKNKKRMDI